MKKRFLPFSLLLVIMILGQSIAIADNGGHYVPRTQGTASAASFMSDLRVNQHTGLIDPACMLKAAQGLNTKDEADLYWLSMGPDNMGGQTTAVVFDNRPNEHNNPNGVVYIGSKGGGVYKTYNHGITWHQVGDQNLMVSCMAQDAEGNIYVGTGDCGYAATYNGLDQQGYENSFIGTGVYRITNDVMTQIVAPTETEWNFVNDIVVMDGKVIAATNEGLMVSADKGQTWNNILEGRVDEVKVTADNKAVVSVDGNIYIGTLDNLVNHSDVSIQMDENNNIVAIPTATAILDIATAPSNAQVIYAACIKDNGQHEGFYVSADQGATWKVILPAANSNYGHNIYSSYGLNNHGLTVSPTDEGRLYVCGYDLFELVKPENGQGNYVMLQLSSGSNTSLYDSPEAYLHVGLHTLVFNPYKNSECYIGTDGGIFKAEVSNNGFTFTNCNRNYVTARMFNVAPSGVDTHIMGAGLDHGTVMIEGNPEYNTLSHAEWINPTGYNNGTFAESAQAGPCIISTINPKTIFVTYKEGGLKRSETAGADWVSTNFSENLSALSTSSFRLPIMLYENYNDALNEGTVWYKNETENAIAAGTAIKTLSNSNYPFTFTLTAPLAAGDSIEVHDPISTQFYVAFTNELYVTRGALQFSTGSTWYEICNKSLGLVGEPLSMGLTADGDNIFVGTKDGVMVRVSNLTSAVNDSTANLTDTINCILATTVINLPIDGQCITSIAVDPRDGNKVVVTLGNYGNDAYVLYSTNALADEPTFTSMQGNLPKMPVYSSVIEMESGKVIIGTEHGIYMCNGLGNANWKYAGKAMGDVPVMDLKQQVLSRPLDSIVETIVEESATFEVTKYYQGVYNTGIIYAATYGKGLFRCENFKQTATGVEENGSIVAESHVVMYPNPVRDQAMISFNVNGNANVTYQVFDMMGRMVMNQNVGRMAEGEQQIEVNMSELSAGSYIMRVNQGSNSSTVKFLVY